jgi:hypothetical protein
LILKIRISWECRKFGIHKYGEIFKDIKLVDRSSCLHWYQHRWDKETFHASFSTEHYPLSYGVPVLGTVWFYTSTSNKRAARPKLYTESLTRDLKLMYSRFTLVRISIKL